MRWRANRIHEEILKSREETNRLLDQQDERNADMRQFMREERLRANKVLEPMLATLAKLVASHDQLIAEFRSECRDLRAESRAQRAALFRMLDELGGRGGSKGEASA